MCVWWGGGGVLSFVCIIMSDLKKVSELVHWIVCRVCMCCEMQDEGRGGSKGVSFLFS